jgi:hypothetical protein
MRCRNCKHWEQGDFNEMGFACHTPDMELGECKIAWPGYGDPKQKFLAVATCNSEGIYGELITQADFGCIQFEEKINKPC